MSLEDVPRELHTIVLSYLPIDEIYLAYQPTCKDWYANAAQAVTEFSMSYFSGAAVEEAETKLSYIAERFPNLKRIIWEPIPKYDSVIREQYTTFNTISNSLRQMKLPNLEIVHGNNFRHKHVIMFCDEIENSTEWKHDILSRFPKYCAVDVTRLSRNNTKEQILADLQNTKITHALFSNFVEDENKEQLIALFDFILPTLTHLTVNIPTWWGGTRRENVHLWNVILQRIANYSGELKLTHIYDFCGGYDCEKLFSRTPHLKEIQYVTGTELEHVELALSLHCPNLTKLTGRNFNSVQEVFLAHLTNLKTFEFCYAPSVTQNTVEVSSLQNWWEPKETYPNLKRIFFGLEKEQFDTVVKYAPNLEEVLVYEMFTKEDALTLIKLLPKLRFIHGLSSAVIAPRLRNGNVDVVRWRENIARDVKEESYSRPTKRIRTRK